ncbi:MAG: PHP domain-containing protein [Nitriliruptoraceae bacterium]
MTAYDMHTHSTFSDGTTTIEENVRDAAALGLAGIAVTDHDTVEPFDLAIAAGDAAGIEIVVGTEFSAELDGLSVHLLGYWVAADDPELTGELYRLRNERTERARLIVGKFVELGIGITFERVQQIAGAAPIGRPHVAQAVIEAGAARTVDEVFERYLADGRPANVRKHAVDPIRGVELLTGAGGVAVLAHPGLYGDRDGHGGIPADVVEAMAQAGLSGIEADHPDHTDGHRRTFRDLAKALGLEVTAGSDYHGTTKTNRLGSTTTDAHVVDRLRAHARQ